MEYQLFYISSHGDALLLFLPSPATYLIFYLKYNSGNPHILELFIWINYANLWL